MVVIKLACYFLAKLARPRMIFDPGANRSFKCYFRVIFTASVSVRHRSPGANFSIINESRIRLNRYYARGLLGLAYSCFEGSRGIAEGPTNPSKEKKEQNFAGVRPRLHRIARGKPREQISSRSVFRKEMMRAVLSSWLERHRFDVPQGTQPSRGKTPFVFAETPRAFPHPALDLNPDLPSENFRSTINVSGGNGV